jgi:hypothetical protein
MPPTGEEIRRVLLEVIAEYSGRDSSFQSGTVLNEAKQRLGIYRDIDLEQALLTLWHDLFRTGYLAWGYNLSNPNPPFCHLTNQGRRTLQHLSRDPANPDGYIHHLNQSARLNTVSNSYLQEALVTFNADCFKAAAVMIGASAESLVLELRDILVAKITSLSKSPAKDLEDWRIKKVLDAVKKEIDSQRAHIPTQLWEAYQGFWPAFTQQIRAARNDAGHPTNIDPVTQETVHASLLIFPELAKLANDLGAWITANYT